MKIPFRFPKLPPFSYLLLTPPLLYVFGFLLNSFAMAANQAQMPVLFPGGCDPQFFRHDIAHTCMVPATHLKMICDWIPLGDGIASPGDFGIFAFTYIFWPCLVAWVALVWRESTSSKITIDKTFRL